MRAVIYGQGATCLDAELAKPGAPASGNLLVRVAAAALNPVDYKKPSIPGVKTEGLVVGLDFAGTVVAVNADVNVEHVFNEGDCVFGATSGGTLQEFIEVAASKVSIVPPGLSLVEAASLCTVGLTALQSLRTGGLTSAHHDSPIVSTRGADGSLTERERVLVIGGSGGCGSVGVMVAKALGAHVTASCSAKNLERVRGHGADEVVDYTSSEKPFGDRGEFNIIYDTVTGSSSDDKNYQSLRKTHLAVNGNYVCINGGVGDWISKFAMPKMFATRNFHLMLTEHIGNDMQELAEMVEHGMLKPQVMTCSDATAANVQLGFELLAGRRCTGKLCFSFEEVQSERVRAGGVEGDKPASPAQVAAADGATPRPTPDAEESE